LKHEIKKRLGNWKPIRLNMFVLRQHFPYGFRQPLPRASFPKEDQRFIAVYLNEYFPTQLATM
jgi:hypothetical protein